MNKETENTGETLTKNQEGGRFCRYCNKEYELQWTTHLKVKHREILNKRNKIKNGIRIMDGKQLQQILDFVLKIRKEMNNGQQG